MIKKISLFVLALCLWYSVAAKNTVHYVFDQLIDENIRDRSGNGCVPFINMGENSWVSKGEDALRFSSPSDVVKIPFKAFPASQGIMKIKINFDKIYPGTTQTIWRIYGRKDGMLLQLHKNGSLVFAYYDRSGKRWHKAVCPKNFICPDQWLNITCVWQFGKTMKLYVNGIKRGQAQLNTKPDWASNTIMLMGNDVSNSAPYKGVVRYLKISDDLAETPPQTALKLTSKLKSPLDPVSIEQGKIRLIFDRKKLILWSIKDIKSGTELLSQTVQVPLWEITFISKDNFKNKANVNAFSRATISCTKKQNGIELNWEKIYLPDGLNTFSVKALLTQNKANGQIEWRLKIPPFKSDWRIFAVNYPCLPLAMTNPDPKKCFLAWPYRWGRLSANPFKISKENTENTSNYGTVYPGSMHFQFCYLYGAGKPGLYLETRDSAGHYKEFNWTALPRHKTLIQKVVMSPSQRGISKSFDQPYPVVTAVMNGDWYNAARRYRSWAIKQKWCAKGTIASNKEIPQWYKNTSIAMKWSTSKPARTISNNKTNTGWILEHWGHPAMGIWYHYRGNWKSKDTAGIAKGWYGCTWNARIDAAVFAGVKHTVHEMKSKDCYLIGYLNSRIFDQSLDKNHQDSNTVIPHTMKEPDGRIQYYGKVCYEVCRFDKWWQNRLLTICREGVKNIGFSGMYLDSFGRGQYFCYDKHHGHLPGSSTASIIGMRKMGSYIKHNLRNINPDIIISSEASIEQFVDLIDAKLLHYNIFADCCPIWQTIYHDYQLTYGRGIYPAQTPDRLLTGRVNMASTLHIGAQIGRFRPDGSPKSFMKNWNSKLGLELQSTLKNLLHIRQKNLKYLAWGEMLRPVTIRGIKKVKVKTMKFSLMVPQIFSSSWRANDGSVGIFFTNVTNKPLKIEYEYDKQEYKLNGKTAYLFKSEAINKITEKPYSSNSLTIPAGKTVGIIFK
jgi:hypothetical protein